MICINILTLGKRRRLASNTRERTRPACNSRDGKPRIGVDSPLVQRLILFAFIILAPAFLGQDFGRGFDHNSGLNHGWGFGLNFGFVCFGQDSGANGLTAGASVATAPAPILVQQTIDRGLEWLASQQARNGSWSAQNGGYVTAMTSLAVLALTAEGSTTMQGKYSVQIRRGVDFLLTQARPTGLIGVPHDGQYTYGHGYAMMALAQVLGEEEDVDRREQLIKTLVRAVAFTVDAQTKDGGWGYVSA